MPNFEECIDYQRGAGGVQFVSAATSRWRAHLVWILPKAAAASVARSEPYGLAILIGLLIVLPLLGAQLGLDLSVLSRAVAISTRATIEAILHVTGKSRGFHPRLSLI